MKNLSAIGASFKVIMTEILVGLYSLVSSSFDFDFHIFSWLTVCSMNIYMTITSIDLDQAEKVGNVVGTYQRNFLILVLTILILIKITKAWKNKRANDDNDDTTTFTGGDGVS